MRIKKNKQQQHWMSLLWATQFLFSLFCFRLSKTKQIYSIKLTVAQCFFFFSLIFVRKIAHVIVSATNMKSHWTNFSVKLFNTTKRKNKNITNKENFNRKMLNNLLKKIVSDYRLDYFFEGFIRFKWHVSSTTWLKQK